MESVPMRADRLRLQIVFADARFLRVPIDIHGSFFANGKKLRNTSALSIAPK